MQQQMITAWNEEEEEETGADDISRVRQLLPCRNNSTRTDVCDYRLTDI